ncbi:type II toxin-antitoxin system ParD family antitoxin [Alloacidobacterium sp.]|uniref:type II toxin-antitoxin system ParD family antitoxin n=1 Tax=Alloacidobacterium sp. TaxID=2951999 RepID=UPI002D3EE17D|nr:type II toxin-antitoxin system ParD family antitoxin [Alloacidobacterium sp.]HYK34399.1 type II toxin-antitoxin system ParD family antitoxin [Alloacidobacterium sp.]
MPTRNFHLSAELDAYVNDRVESGQYANASEVLRAGLRQLQQSELEDKAKVEALRAAVKAGINSGVAEGDVIARLRQRVRNRAATNKRKTA